MIPLRVDILRTRVAIFNALLILVNVLAFLHELSLSPKTGQRARLHIRAHPVARAIAVRQARHHLRAGDPSDVHEHVPARRMDAPAGQHAVSLGIWRGRRRSAGAFSISHLLLDLRGWARRLCTRSSTWLEGSHGRRERGDFRGHGGVYCVVSAGARDDADSCAAVVFHCANSRRI